MKSLFTAAALGATVSGYNQFELDNFMDYQEQSFIDQIDNALEAADLFAQEEVAEEAVATPVEEDLTNLANVRPLKLGCGTNGLGLN